MKKTITLMLTIAALLLAVVGVQAEDNNAKTTAPKELKNQTHCPVMGGKIDSTVYTDIQGQRVYHCCPGCSANLAKDPDTYFKKAAEAGILFENIQTTCPVSGDTLTEKKIFSDFEGRRIYFCCERCPETFAKDPQKYLKEMLSPQEKPSEKTDDHSMHNH